MLGQRLLFRQKKRRDIPFHFLCEYQPETRRREWRYMPFKTKRDVHCMIIRALTFGISQDDCFEG